MILIRSSIISCYIFRSDCAEAIEISDGEESEISFEETTSGQLQSFHNGLVNNDLTCYQNSILQLLIKIPVIRQTFDALKPVGGLLSLQKQIFWHLQDGSHRPMNTESFTAALA